MTRLALALVTAAALAAPATASAAPEVRTAAGATPAALDSAVAAFRADVGAARREIDWDGAPEPPPRLPSSPPAARSSTRPAWAARSSIPPDPPGAPGMKPYSGKQLFTPVGSNVTDVRFNVPGTSPARRPRAAFGIVLSDVDTATGAALTFFDTRGKVDLQVAVPAGPNGLSFVSVRFTGGERVARVELRAGSARPLEAGRARAAAGRRRRDRRRDLRRAAGQTNRRRWTPVSSRASRSSSRGPRRRRCARR